tara:strand:+ start:15667 stop:15891 length:225 start_codon:yes stop_codon:yes gene_type:complete
MSPILSQRGFLFQLVLAMHHTSTLCAPASSNVRASADGDHIINNGDGLLMDVSCGLRSQVKRLSDPLQPLASIQ